MNELYPQMRLIDICDQERGIRYGILKVGNFTPNGIPVIRGGDIKSGKVTYDDKKKVTQEISDQFKRTILKGGEIVINLIGEAGHSAVVPREYNGFNVSRDVAVIPLKSSIDTRFIDFYLRSAGVIEWMRQRLQGSVTQKINLETLRDVPVYLPPIYEQNAIAHILGTLDDKIELNRSTNETLEAMAKALFKSWFVDFDPVRARAEGRPTGLPDEISDLFPDSLEESEFGEIPKGWQQRELQEIGYVIDPHPSHRAPREVTDGFPFAGIGDIDQMGNINRSKARVVDEESVLEQENCYEINGCSSGFGRVGTVGKVVRLRKQSFRYAISPTLAIVNPVKSCYGALCYLLLGSPGLQAKVLSRMTGSTRPAIGIQILRKIPTLLPPESSRGIYDYFESSVRVLIERGDSLNAQTCSLIQARDALLPKLISGELRIPNAERMLKEVGL